MIKYQGKLSTSSVKVDRSQKGEVPIRVRTIACMNPRRRVSSYIFPAEAILDSIPFEDAVDVTRWDAFVPFDERDVSYDNIVEAIAAESPKPSPLYRAHIMWAWSRRMEDVAYGTGFVEKVKELSRQLNARYRIASLPLVYNEVHDTLTRVAVSFAVMRHSTDGEHQKVIVLEDHAQEAYLLMMRAYDMLKLAEYREYEEGQTNLLGSEFARLVTGGLSPDDFSILEAIKTGRRTSEELAEILGMSPEAVRRYHYPKLSEHGLIETRKMGCRLSDKGRAFIKRWLEFCAPASSEPSAREAALAVNPEFTAAPSLEALMFEDGTGTEHETMDTPPAGRSAEETVAEIKRNMTSALGRDWKQTTMDDVGLFLKHMFGEDEYQAKESFRTAYGEQRLPYHIRADGTVLRRARPTREVG